MTQPRRSIHAGDTVYLDNQEYQITELREDTVQLLPTGMSYPIYRTENRERFEQLLRADNRNSFYTGFLPVNPDTADQDLRDVLTHGLIGEAGQGGAFRASSQRQEQSGDWPVVEPCLSQHRGNDGAGDRRDRRLPHDAGRY